MRHLLLTLSLFLSLGMLADHHKKSDENAKNSPKNPNHLMIQLFMMYGVRT